MPADLYLFTDDQIQKPFVSLSVSGTDAGGYSVDHLKNMDLASAWKAPNSTTTDVWIRVDGGSTTWLGTTGQTAYAVLAWDARGSDQDRALLVYGALDDGSFSGGDSFTSVATWQLNSYESEITMRYVSWTIPATPKRYYRVQMWGTERTEAAGSVLPKIYSLAMFNSSDVIRLAIDYPGDAEGHYNIPQEFRATLGETAGGHRVSNKWANPGQSFTVAFRPASDALWQRLRNDFFALGGQRAIYVQKTGLRNEAQSNFFMCRMVGLRYGSSVTYPDQYDVEMDFETCPWL